MKITFVIAGVENLGVEYLSSVLKSRGHQVSLVFDPRLFASEAIQNIGLSRVFNIKKRLAREVIDSKPDLIAFSVFTINYQWALEIARMIKQKISTPIIFGGIHATSVPEVVLENDCIDMVCVGEGEEAIVELVESLDKGERRDIPNIWFKQNNVIIKNELRDLIADLDSLPLPDKQLFYNQQPFAQRDYYIMSSRGCPFDCAYCSNNVWHNLYQGKGRHYRKRSADNVIKELAWAKASFKPRRVTFADDFFVSDAQWLEQFIFRYKAEIGLPFVAMGHPNHINGQTVGLLKKGGCFWLIMGVESVSKESREKTLKRFMNNAQVAQAAAACHSQKLNFAVDHIFNIPGEGLEEQIQALKFYNQIRPQAINAYWLQYFPKAQIIETARKLNIIQDKDIEKINRGEASASMVIALGGRDTIGSNNLSGFYLLFMLLPLLPESWVEKIAGNKKFLSGFKAPRVLAIIAKVISSVRYGRSYVYTDMLSAIFYNIGFGLRKRGVK